MRPPPGKRGMKSRRVRLEDIARQCGVSLSTASRALAGEKGVRAEVRQQILEAAKTASYGPPAAVAGQRVIVAASSAAMIDYVRNQFTLYVLEGLNERARALGLEITTRPIADHAEELAMLEEARSDDRVAGVLFLTVDDETMLAATSGLGKPVVLVNGDDPDMRLSSVTPCNRSAARLATDYLIGHGHRRILFLMCSGRRTIQRRREGWQDALLAQGIPVTDDLPQASFLTPPLTSMHVPKREIGMVALDLLRDALSGPPMPARRVELACHIVERQSVGRAAATKTLEHRDEDV